MSMEGTLEVLGGTILFLLVALSSLKLWKKRRYAGKPTGPSPSPVVFHPLSPAKIDEKGNLPPDSVEKSDGIEAKAKEEEHLAQKNIGEEEAKAKAKAKEEEEEETPKQKGKEEEIVEEEEEETPKPKAKEEAAPRSEEKGIEADEAQRPSPSLKRRAVAVAVGDNSGEIETPIDKLEKPPVPDSLKKSGSFLSKIVSFGRLPAEEGDRNEKHNGDKVDTDAEKFIEKFKKQLRLQRMESILRYKETMNKEK